MKNINNVYNMAIYFNEESTYIMLPHSSIIPLLIKRDIESQKVYWLSSGWVHLMEFIARNWRTEGGRGKLYLSFSFHLQDLDSVVA